MANESVAVPSEVRANYVTIIDAILAESDLARISEKKIRQGIQAKVEYDITPQKVCYEDIKVQCKYTELTSFQAAIKGLILERFDIFNARQQQEASKAEKAAPPAPTTNGYYAPTPKSPTPRKSPVKRDATSEPLSDVMDESPPKKKRKEPSVDADAAFAARLQAEEDKRARPTRGGSSRKVAPVKKKTPKKKTATRIRGSDESGVEDSAIEKKPKNNGFNVSPSPSSVDHSLTDPQKPMNLSQPLSELLRGETAVSFPSALPSRYAKLRSCPDHSVSNASGSTSVKTTYRIQMTGGTLSAMTRCVGSSSRKRSICSP
jgi:upstream activation factor subunit UAF30